jgi:hypothetical protein
MKLAQTLSLFATSILIGGCTSLQFSDPHEHVVDVHATPWLTEDAPHVVILEVFAFDKIRHENVCTNQSKTMVAFTMLAGGPPDWQAEHVYFQKLGTDERFVILGIPLEHRPFSDLVWVNDRYLVFDRWSSPHYGRHYVVDTTQKKLLLATPFPDQFYLDQKNGNRKPTPAH